MPKSVRTKTDFVHRYLAGEFGNAAPTWGTVEEYLTSKYDGLVHIRNRVAGAPTWYNISAESFLETWRVVTRKVCPSLLYISAMAPTEKTLFQGEVIQSVHHLDLHYATVTEPMRAALFSYGHHASGVMTLWLLHRYLCPTSYEWLRHLLDAYPNHAIEFSTYSVNWGTLPHHNTVFWEVRLY